PKDPQRFTTAPRELTEEELATKYGSIVTEFLEAIRDTSEFVNFAEHVGEVCERIEAKRARAEAKAAAKRIPVDA
ncbi:MAG TPA: hypothetical protein VEV82_01955, partial [Actinomycetota bacterium]|nr:hypothetical protein [Actinomycetota bacterium]